MSFAWRHFGFSAPSVRINQPAFQLVTLPSYDSVHQGGLTGALVYPDLWWRHDAVGLRG
jgi:putative acetyltransferase